MQARNLDVMPRAVRSCRERNRQTARGQFFDRLLCHPRRGDEGLAVVGQSHWDDAGKQGALFVARSFVTKEQTARRKRTGHLVFGNCLQRIFYGHPMLIAQPEVNDTASMATTASSFLNLISALLIRETSVNLNGPKYAAAIGKHVL